MSKLRNASSLVLVTKNKLIQNSLTKANNVNVLTLKRSRKASHFPNSYVFPGGNCDAADEISDWLKLFPPSELNVQLNLKEEFSNFSNKSVLPQAISSRITAIRETFEECGILLCKRTTDHTEFFASNFKLENRDDWRIKISNDPFEFYNFCCIHNCFPNLKSIHLLSNWVTPTTYTKRFNSVFFITAVDHEIEGEADHKEIEEIKWESTNYFLESESIFLPPPQRYELTKLQNFANFDDLCKFIETLNHSVCETYLPVHVNTTDGFIMILPGDEKYEKFLNDSSEKTIDLDCDIDAFRGKIMNRVEYKYSIDTNVHDAKAKVIIQNVINHNIIDTSLHSNL